MEIDPDADLDEVETSETPAMKFDRAMYIQSFSMLERESTLFWRRAYVFLIVHGAFISVISIGQLRGVLLPILSVFGILFSLIWLSVLESSQNYVYKWGEIINEFESNFNEKYDREGDYIFELYDEVDDFDEGMSLPNTLEKRTSTLIQYVVFLIMLFWGVLFIYGVWTEITALDRAVISDFITIINHA